MVGYGLLMITNNREVAGLIAARSKIAGEAGYGLQRITNNREIIVEAFLLFYPRI